MSFKIKHIKLPNLLLKIMAMTAVLAIVALAVMIEAYAIKDIISISQTIIEDYSKDNTIIKDSLKALDLVLLGVIFITIALGLFELYIKKLNHFPKWLEINNLDDLKKLMIKMIIFVMAVSFSGRLITYTDGPYITYLGLGFALVIASLTYFLNSKD